MKKVFLGIILYFSALIVVDASSISKIDMDIYVDNFGTATVTETWDAIVDEGTEGWHPYYNIGSSEIYDVKASMDGREFTTVSNWNEDSSLSSKAYKAGLYYVDDGEVDVVFGVSSYGHHEYEIQYKISNFVARTDDSDMIYWNLFPYDFSVEPGNVTIKIYSDFRYLDTLDVWGYGKEGAPCYVADGFITMTSDGILTSDEYMTILVKFDKGTFQTNNVLDESFEYYSNMANEGAVQYNDNSTHGRFDFVAIFIFVLSCIVFPVFILLAIVVASNSNQKVKFGKVGNKVRKDVPNFRDIPCQKDIFRAYWVASNYNLIKKKEDFLGSVLLSWLKNGNIRMEQVIKNGILKDKKENVIVFLEEPQDISLEKKLYHYMQTASGDNRLESNEFKRWCSSHYSEILKWFDDVLEWENKMLVNEGKAKVVTVGRIFKHDIYEIDDSMMQEAEQMAGLKKFLKEFSMIKERESIEVHLWNEYLIYAQIFGIADKVASQFKKLYPEVIQEMEHIGYNYNDILFIHSISSAGINSAKSKAQSYSSGGGGFSSGGGGFGSFGGGGGGGGFR